MRGISSFLLFSLKLKIHIVQRDSNSIYISLISLDFFSMLCKNVGQSSMVHVGSLAVSGPRAKLGNLKFCSPLQTRDINLTKVIDTQRWHLTTKSINLLGGGGVAYAPTDFIPPTHPTSFALL